MKRQFSIILAAVLLGLVLAVVPVKAQDRTIADIREDLQHLLTQLYTIDNACVIILGALLNEALIDILDTRKLITVGKGNLSPLVEEALQDALTKFDLAQNQINQCSNATDEGLIDTFAAELGALQEDIINVAELDVRKRNKINALLVNANGRLGDDNVPADPDTGIRGRLADVVELCLDATAGSGSARDLVNDAQSIAQNASADWDVLPAGEHIAIPNLTEKGPITFEELRTIKIELGRAAAIVKSCLRAVKEITKEKKWIFKAIREVYNLLRASNFGGRGASESSGVTQVYALNGALIETQLGGLNINRLPIGVYLTVTEARDASGKVHQQVRKVTVVH
jgi:hypothetical protein